MAIDLVRVNDTIDGLEAMLSQVLDLRSEIRSEEQRKIAILVTKIEDCVAWAKHAFESQR